MTPTAIVAAPGHAFALSVLRDGRTVVLAGDRRSKGVWLVPMRPGRRKSFSVSNGATSIGTTTSGEILVGLAIGNTGAVEVWSAAGRQRRTVPVSGPVVAVVGGEKPLAIVSHGAVAAAEQLDLARARIERVIPLPRNVVWAADCFAGDRPGVVVADDRSVITVVRLSDAVHAQAGSRGRAPLCLPAPRLLCALSPPERGRDTVFELFSLRTLLQVHEIPTNRNAVAQTLAPDGGVYLLDSGPRKSTVTSYSRSTLTTSVENGSD